PFSSIASCLLFYVTLTTTIYSLSLHDALPICFLYSMDFADDDIPYVVERQGGRLVAIPYQYDLNDMGLYAYSRQPPSVYFEFFRRKFDYLYAEGMAGDPKMLNATVHAQLFGRAFGASVLEECIRYAQRFSGVWFA